MQRALLFAAVLLLAWMAGRMSAEPMTPAPVVIVPPVQVNLPPAPEPPDPLPAPPLPSFQERGRGRLALRDVPHMLTSWSGIVAAPGAPVLAVWNDKVVSWSGDDGATWTRHPLPDGHGVGFATAESGWVHLLLSSGEQGVLWSFAPDGTRTVGPAPLAPLTVSALSGGSGRLAVLGLRNAAPGATVGPVEKERALLLSADHGATWKNLPAPSSIGNSGNVLTIEPDGAVGHMLGWESSCGGGYQNRVRLADGASEWAPLAWPLDAPLSFWLGPGGWAYAADESCGVLDPAMPGNQEVLCAVGPGDDKAQLGPKLDPGAQVDIVSNGRVTLAVAGRALFAVKGGKFRRVATDVPPSLQSGARVDAGGRLVAIAAGHVVRWSAAGWEVLLPG